jgi:hypothetical protein
MCAVSTRMAFLHRRFYLTARNAFLGTGASSMFLGYFLWTRAAAAAAGVLWCVWNMHTYSTANKKS